MVLNVLAPRTPVEAVQIGGTTYLRGDNSTAVAAHTGASTLAAVGAIIEVKPFQQACERCDTCPCIGCGHRCECSCNALCRQRREPNCAHTAGVLSPGRWYIGIDAPAEFTLTATLVGALALRTGEALGPRTLFGAGAQPLLDARASSSEGAAFADYFYYDPAPHERLDISVDLHRTGDAAATRLAVYIRFGDWPTTTLHDAQMEGDLSRSPRATFTLAADRLLNERLCILVLATGPSWAVYTVTAHAAPSGRLMLALGVAVGILALALGALVRTMRARPHKPTLGIS